MQCCMRPHPQVVLATAVSAIRRLIPECRRLTLTRTSNQKIWYKGWLSGIGASPVNFYDTNDSVVLSIWDANNSAFKPQRFNGWSLHLGMEQMAIFTILVGSRGSVSGITYLLSVGRFIIDPAEAKSYADFSQTGTIGGANKQAGRFRRSNH